MSDGNERSQWGLGQVVQSRRTGYYHHVMNRYIDADDRHVLYRIACPTHTRYDYIREVDAVHEYRNSGFRLPVGVKPASAFGHRVEGILYGYNERPHDPVPDGGQYLDTGIDRWRKARKKPVEVEFRGPYRSTDIIETIEGDFEIDEEYIEEHGGYVIIRGVEGEVYPCGLDIFRETYEQVRNDPSLETDTERGGQP